MADHRSPLRQSGSIEKVSERLAAITSVDAKHRRNPLSAYLHLVHNKRLLVPAVWVLINLRHSPVWVFPLLIGHVFDLIASPEQKHRVMGDLWWVMTVSFYCAY